MSVSTLHGDCRAILPTLAAASVHSVVTSPPYFGLRNYGVAGQIGLEPTPDAYVAELVAVFREVRRVLRNDGTLWINLGDSYNAARDGGHAGGAKQASLPRHEGLNRSGANVPGLKPKDLIGIPWRLAFALQADGWTLRQDIIWSKPSCMPESIRDRCTKSHEYIFLLTKSERYFFDQIAIAEPIASELPSDMTRNKRSVWEVATQRFAGAHFAVMPTALIEPCIQAGSSEKGCCAQCGAPWRRQTEKIATGRVRERNGGGLGTAIRREPLGLAAVDGQFKEGVVYKTIGWLPSCTCNATATPCTILDPFAGAGTVGLVADRLQRNAVMIELNPDYAAMADRRIYEDAPLFHYTEAAE